MEGHRVRQAQAAVSQEEALGPRGRTRSAWTRRKGGAGGGFPARDGAVLAGAAGADRAAGRAGAAQQRDRRPAGRLRGHGPQVAPPLPRAVDRRAGRRAPAGPPRKFPARAVAEVKALACEPPAASGEAAGPLDLPRAGPPAARRHRRIGCGVDGASRGWPRTRSSRRRAGRRSPPGPALRPQGRPRSRPLPAREWERQPLGEDEYALSADEKPGIQARSRTGLPLPPRPRAAARVESEYIRHGTLAYLAAYDVHRANVIGRCEPTTGIKPFTALVDQVMRAEPYASARRVFSVVDNGAWHRNSAARHG